MGVPFVDLSGIHGPIAGQIKEATAGVMDGDARILGDSVERFERDFAEYCGVKHAVGVESGASALELCLRAWGIGPGDEVITAPNCFAATASAIAATGAKPVPVDVDAATYNMDPAKVHRALRPRTQAIVPVHLYGQPADMDPIVELAERAMLKVLEDASHAPGARYKGRPVGSLADAAAFSFHPASNLGAFGDAGMVVTDDADLAEKVRVLRNHGQEEKHNHPFLSYSRRLDSLQAAVLGVKLEYLDEWNAKRRQAAAWYSEALSDSGLILPEVGGDAEHVYRLYVVRSDDRARLEARLDAADIEWGIHYPVPIHLQPAFEWLGLDRSSLPVAESLAAEILSLPMHPSLTEDDIARVADAVRTRRQAA